MIFEHEALLLAEVSGREMVSQPWRRLQEVDIDLDSTIGMPCPFLVDDSCSVYEHRPLFCRLRHSLSEDPDECAVDSRTGGQVPTYAAEAMFIDPYVALSVRTSGIEPLGSIHRYFPER
jgi:Fe-S-cluster containining protein